MHENVLKKIKSTQDFRKEALPIAKARFSTQRLDNLFNIRGSSDKRSRKVIDCIFFKQRIIHNIVPSTETKFLGLKLKIPLMIAPMASMATLFEDGIGLMCDATLKTGSLTWIASNPKKLYVKHTKENPIVFIEKPLADRKLLLNKLITAEEEGCIAVGVDIDSAGRQIVINKVKSIWKPLNVNELRDLRKNLSKPFIIKGILSVEDAIKAMKVKADAIVVSNHYGVALDYAQAPLEVLAAIKEAVGDQVEVLVDCQMRSGADILKALALGGSAVLVGRPIIWAALVGGAKGIEHLLRLMTKELQRTMLYTGVENVMKISKDVLVLPKEIFGYGS